jgi:hypothetical protein
VPREVLDVRGDVDGLLSDAEMQEVNFFVAEKTFVSTRCGAAASVLIPYFKRLPGLRNKPGIFCFT